MVCAAVGPNSDLYDIAARTGKFIVHLCQPGQSGIADVFAGIRPSPGGLFAGLDVEDTEFGPSIRVMPGRAYCTDATIEPIGWSGLLTGTIESVAFGDNPEPLIHYRGNYRSLSRPE